MGDLNYMDNVKMLNKLYQISEMGILGINDVISLVKNKKIIKTLEEERKEYNNILNKTKEIFIKYGTNFKGIPLIAKKLSKATTISNYNKNNTDNTIILMMIKGTCKGITKLTTYLKEYENNDKEITNLSLELLKNLKNNLKTLKIYL